MTRRSSRFFRVDAPTMCAIVICISAFWSPRPVAAQQPSGSFVFIRTGLIEGAIVPADRAVIQSGLPKELQTGQLDRFTPMSKDIRALEVQLRADLAFAARYPRCFGGSLSKGALDLRSKQLAFILANYDSKYRRQYVGFNIDGTQFILVNSFSKANFHQYLERYVIVYDGGPMYWTILYSVDGNSFESLRINGNWSSVFEGKSRTPEELESIRQRRQENLKKWRKPTTDG